MGSNKNNLKRSKVDDIFNTTFDDPKPFQFTPSAPKANRLATCPNCKVAECSEFLSEAYLDRYCQNCGQEERTSWQESSPLLPELRTEIQNRIHSKKKACF